MATSNCRGETVILEMVVKIARGNLAGEMLCHYDYEMATLCVAKALLSGYLQLNMNTK